MKQTQPKNGASQVVPATNGHISPKDYKRTDLGNAERLYDGCSEGLRYCHVLRSFLVWDGARFELDHKGEAPVMERAKDIFKEMYTEALAIPDYEARKSLLKYALTCESKSRLENAIGLLKKDMRVAVAPHEMDRDSWLLNVGNGTLDLRNMKLLPHDHRSLITKVVPIEYDPTATCPMFKQFLLEVMDGDMELVRFIQRAVGYSLTGDVSEQVLFFLYGNGANGKGVLNRLIQRLMGDYSQVVNSDIMMLSKIINAQGPTPEIAKLKGARYVAATETTDGKRLDESKLKDLTGNDRITARVLHGDPFEFDPTHKFWISGNYKPQISGTDYGIWRRICLIPFNVSFTPNPTGNERQRDDTIDLKLQTEMPGILAWAVRGCSKWQNERLRPPEAVLNAVAEYRSEMDILGQFLDECTEKSPEFRTSSTELFQAFRAWATRTGNYGFSQTKFGLEMGKRGIVKDKSMGLKRYEGIHLTTEAEQDNSNVYRG